MNKIPQRFQINKLLGAGVFICQYKIALCLGYGDAEEVSPKLCLRTGLSEDTISMEVSFRIST